MCALLSGPFFAPTVVDREFSHRVKSVSMAKFNTEEVNALQAGGNESVPAFPNSAKSRNPFDLNDDNNQAQGPMFAFYVACARSIAKFVSSYSLIANCRYPLLPFDVASGFILWIYTTFTDTFFGNVSISWGIHGATISQ
ncbi:unnamed protein product [Camellia sinensis]